MIYIYRFIIGLSCCITVIMSCKYISDKYKDKNVILALTNTGRNTLGIYLLQTYTLEMLISNLHLELNSTTLYITALFLSIIEFLLCNYLVIKMRHYNIVRTLLLGEIKA